MIHEVRTETGPRGKGVPVKSWATAIEEKTWEQAANLSLLPFATSHVALMPDAHPGYGMPIGGVLFADRAIVPGAVGVDIGCGVRLLHVKASLVGIDSSEVLKILEGVRDRVPVGNGPQAQFANQPDPWQLPSSAQDVSDVAAEAMNRAETQLGTLGGGNHFLELQRDPEARLGLEDMYFMLHSGSRSFGKRVCDHWQKVAASLNRRWHSKGIYDPALAYLAWDSDEGRAYHADMRACMLWAEENRRRMALASVEAIQEVVRAEVDMVVDVHHNYAEWEHHGTRDGIVHRKGAVRADVGQVVLIPGSMGTASYVGVGLGSEESFRSCQHGAGRARSRSETRRSTTVEAMHAQMASVGVILVSPDDSKVTDESSIAYKDVDEVMAASTDLVRATQRLVPVGVVKG